MCEASARPSPLPGEPSLGPALMCFPVWTYCTHCSPSQLFSHFLSLDQSPICVRVSASSVLCSVEGTTFADVLRWMGGSRQTRGRICLPSHTAAAMNSREWMPSDHAPPRGLGTHCCSPNIVLFSRHIVRFPSLPADIWVRLWQGCVNRMSHVTAGPRIKNCLHIPVFFPQ